MAFKIRIERISDGVSFGETDPVASEEIEQTLNVLAKPSMFGRGNFRFILTPCGTSC